VCLPRACSAQADVADADAACVARARRQRKPELLAALASLPDFRAALRWEFCSPLFAPLLRRFAPHDTYTLTKRGTSLRVDGTLKGLLQEEEPGAGGGSMLPQWDRGAFSLLFSASASASASGSATDDATPQGAQLLLVDHDIREIVDVLPPSEARSEEELAEEVAMLLAAGPAKGKLRAREFRFAPLRTWRGEPRRERAEGWATVVYEAKGRMEAQTRLRSGRFATKVRFRSFASLLPAPCLHLLTLHANGTQMRRARLSSTWRAPSRAARMSCTRWTWLRRRRRLRQRRHWRRKAATTMAPAAAPAATRATWRRRPAAMVRVLWCACVQRVWR
jgi:hypothetical protein